MEYNNTTVYHTSLVLEMVQYVEQVCMSLTLHEMDTGKVPFLCQYQYCNTTLNRNVLLNYRSTCCIT